MIAEKAKPMRTIRELRVEDLAPLSELGAAFFAEGNLPGEFKPAVFIATWTLMLELNRAILLGAIDDEQNGRIVGALGAIISPDLNDGAAVATECFWFVEPEARGCGLRLFTAYEQLAIERGAVRLTMTHLRGLQPDELARLYERRGYRAVEVQYHKEVR